MTTLTGILDWPARTEGRVRQVAGGLPVVRDDDPFVPLSFGERYGLRPGLSITVQVGVRGGHRGQPQGQRHPGPPHHQHQRGQQQHQRGGGGGGGGGGGRSVVESIVAIEGMDPDRFSKTKPFDELTSIDPQPRLGLEYPGCPASCRLVDLFCPIGRGQRGLIVSPPKAGKTTLLKDIAGALLRNHQDIEVILLLIDERPEEMTDFRRSFANMGSTEDLIESGAADEPLPPREGQSPGQPPMHPRCRVIGSSNDHDVEQHIAIAMLTMDRCRRMVEAGRHVVVLMDSLTRLGRAFNRSRKHASSGRTMTGGIDSRALEVPKQIFGAARNTEEAGSLTILATCLVDTGSAGDQVIFEEFKGTGNMELVLDRKISERRLFPAINLAASGTRKEHLLMGEHELKTVTALRRRLINMPPHMQVEQLLAALQRFTTNAGLVGSAG